MSQPTECGGEMSFTAHHIRFTVEALTPLLLPGNAGPSIRGALFGALRHHFCPVPKGDKPDAAHKALCPVCWLMATEKSDGSRGRDVPRPYTVEPPVVLGQADGKARRFEAGERFSFGLTLFAHAVSLFPYLVIATPIMGQAGLGVPLSENGQHKSEKRRGQFRLCHIETVHPLTGEIMPVMGEGQTTVHLPEMPATDQDVATLSDALLAPMDGEGRVQVRFLTPTRIVANERLIKQPWLGPLFRRLLERLDALRSEYAHMPPVAERERLCGLADRVRLVEDQTRWIEVQSTSQRLKRSTWISGYVGEATYLASVRTWWVLLPYLVWGQVTHVGKNATKGSGWYQLA